MNNELIPQNILQVWKSFDSFPMETLTKAWFLKYHPQVAQRDVEFMIQHRAKTGASGNCFDLALWLIHEFERAGIEAYGVAEDLGTEDAHVGVVALDSESRRYLCDLGDLWIQPLCLENIFAEPQGGYFTGARVAFEINQNQLFIKYHRANEKLSEQSYNLTPVLVTHLKEAGAISQRNLSSSLVEMRLWEGNEVIHWEFDEESSFFSRMSGLEKELACGSLEEWSKRIALHTGDRIPKNWSI